MRNFITNTIKYIFILFSIFILAEESYNRYSPSEWWFEYYEPKVVAVPFGDTVRFTSYSEYKRDMKIEWYDTVYCEKESGGYLRGDTQYFTDFKKEGDTSNTESTWKYSYLPDKDLVVSCQLCGSIIGTTPSTLITPKGHIKSQTYCTDNFTY